MRTDDDQWTITQSVGVTALGVASSRAMESRRPDGLVEDPHAAAFLDAVRHEIDLPVEVDPRADPTDPASGLMSTYVGVRSRWFDEHLLDAARDGIDQVLILGTPRGATGARWRARRRTPSPRPSSSRPAAPEGRSRLSPRRGCRPA